MPKVKDDEQTYYICGKCKEKIFYLITEDAPIPCPECDVNVTGSVAVGQHGDGVAQTAAVTVRSKGWEHKGKKDIVPNEVKLDLTQY